MRATATSTDFDLTAELKKTVVHSLTTTFGLDFLLFQDKLGGDANTVHNVRKKIWATEEEKERYENRGQYDSIRYHSGKGYIKKNSLNKDLKKSGKLRDSYTGGLFEKNADTNLDHVIPASQIHNDPAVYLAERDGPELANRETNLASTSPAINSRKRADSNEEFLSKLPEKISNLKEKLSKEKEKLAGMPSETPEQRDKVRQHNEKIKATEKALNELEAVDPALMKKRQKKAERALDEKINRHYYTSTKFLKNSLTTSTSAGLRMGTRQMLGLILAELWFELREALPRIFHNIRQKFSLDSFLSDIKKALQGIWRRLKLRFADFLQEFKNGVFGGIMSSATTILFNIFATTGKNAIKLIREMWNYLVRAIKLLVFNPDKLSGSELTKAVLAILTAGIAAILGTTVYAQLIPLCNFPFGSELAAFLGALVTGLAALGMHYMLLHSTFAKRLWAIVDQGSHVQTLQHFQEINVELDRYLDEWARLEFNMDSDELSWFASDLDTCTSEMQRTLLLKAEVEKQGIILPYEMGTPESTRKWLSSLAKP